MSRQRGKYQRKAAPRPFLWVGILCCVLALIPAFLFGKFLIQGAGVRADNRRTAENYVTPANTQAAMETTPPETGIPEDTTPAAAEPAETTAPPTEPPRFPTIDFDGLREKNEDVVAWLQMPALENINYPIVLGADNAYYTTHSWDNQESDNGAIFLDYRNAGDFSQAHNILYGHCMKDGTMFQPLGKWEGPEFFRTQDKTILLFLPRETRVYEIFAVERVNALDTRVYTTDYAQDETWQTALLETQKASQHRTEDTLTETDQVLTLSTCMGGVERLAVHAVCREIVPRDN